MNALYLPTMSQDMQGSPGSLDRREYRAVMDRLLAEFIKELKEQVCYDVDALCTGCQGRERIRLQNHACILLGRLARLAKAWAQDSPNDEHAPSLSAFVQEQGRRLQNVNSPAFFIDGYYSKSMQQPPAPGGNLPTW